MLNCVLQIPAIVNVVGEAKDWLQFWPVYLSSIASFGMIYYTSKSLVMTQKHHNEIIEKQREEQRARLVFDIIVNNHIYYFRINNIGKEHAFSVSLYFNDDFLNTIPDAKCYFEFLATPFAIRSDKPIHILIGKCDEINKSWEKDLLIKISGLYNYSHQVNETIHTSFYINKSHFVVLDELTYSVKKIRKSVVSGDGYYPIQKSLSIIANKIESESTTNIEDLINQENENDYS